MKKSLYVLLLASLMTNAACGAKEPAKNTETKIATVNTPAETKVKDDIVSRYNYDKDWEMIKKAIINKDVAGIKDWIADPEEVDAANLIATCQTDFFLEALKKSTFDDLVVEELNGEIFLIFFVSISGVDDEGGEVGTAVGLHLIQGEPNLKIVYMIAAG